MKRTITIVIAAILLLLTLTAGAFYWGLQSQYAGPLLNRFCRQFHLPLHVSEVHYQFPAHFTLSELEFSQDQQHPVRADTVQLWIDPLSLLTGTPVIESLLLSGVSLQHGMPQLKLPGNIALRQLAISGLDFADGELSARDVNLQINQPQRDTPTQTIPYGTIQFSAKQVYWKGEAFDDLLLDADYQPENSTVYGLSFRWRDGQFSTQAEQYPTGWSLVNTTIKQLRLNRQQWQRLEQLGVTALGSHISHINSLDLLGSSIETDQWALVNFDLSSEQIDLQQGMWQQQQGYLSLNAESLRYQDMLLVDPAFALQLRPGAWTLSELNTEFQQGLITASGVITPDSAVLSQLSASGVKWIAESARETRLLTDTLARVNNLTIDQLTVRHSQFIQLHGRHKWQISGLNLQGESLELNRDGHWGLWQGQVEASAASASLDRLLASQPMLRMRTQQGIWLLDDLFIPLEKGVVKASGRLDLSSISQPWQLDLTADGLPVELLTQWYPLPIAMEGIAEFQLSASGLGGDDLMLRHSLSGELAGSVRDAAVVNRKGEQQYQTIPVDISALQLSARRGVFNLTPLTLKGDGVIGELEANVDLAGEQQSQLNFTLQQSCREQRWDLLRDIQSLQISCPVEE